MAAHLAGAVAARTVRPVIGIPIGGATLAGMDALFSTVQMPPGFPVATVALDKAGARNAAWLGRADPGTQRPGLQQELQPPAKRCARMWPLRAKKSTANTPEREGRKSAPSALWAQIWL